MFALNGGQWSRVEAPLLKTIIVCLFIVSAWQIGALISNSFHQVSEPKVPPVKLNSANVTSVKGQASYILGRPEVKKVAKPVVKKKPAEGISKTRLNLKLLGVLDMGERGVAIIEKSGKAMVVSLGEKFLPNVVLLDVFANGVLLENNGRQERLLMDESSKGLISAKRQSVSHAPASAPVLSEAQGSKLKAIGSKLRKSPMSISRYIRFKPLNKKGVWVGVQIWSKKDKDIFDALGFKNQDVLKTVNGRSINDMAKEPALWKEFLTMSEFDLEVERKGQLVPISVNLE